jgi:four helix bundle protein
MVAKRFEDLIAWQLAFKLQEEVFAYTATGAAWGDVKHRDQIRDAARSATRNTAEGFGRFRPKEFARFLDIAHGSLDETKNHLHDAYQRKYISTQKYQELLRLAYRALKANVRLGQYLRGCSVPTIQHSARRRRTRSNP